MVDILLLRFYEAITPPLRSDVDLFYRMVWNKTDGKQYLKKAWCKSIEFYPYFSGRIYKWGFTGSAYFHFLKTSVNAYIYFPLFWKSRILFMKDVISKKEINA